MDDKKLGMLIGLHVGDCLGIPLEFTKARTEDGWYDEIVGGGAFGFPAGVGSDDTDLMLCLLRSIAKNKKFELHDIAQNLVKWKHTNPPDIGNTTRMGIANIEKGEMLEECGMTHTASQGNGSIMRCAPLALLDDINPKEIRSQSKLTHGHPICVETDVCFVSLLYWVLAGYNMKQFSVLDFFKDPKVGKDIDQFKIARDYLETCRTLKWDKLPNSGWCIHSLGAALWALHNCPDFETGVLSIINRGDDADTGGAVTGALLGAYYGYEAIPKRWVDKLKSAEEIKELLTKITT